MTTNNLSDEPVKYPLATATLTKTVSATAMYLIVATLFLGGAIAAIVAPVSKLQGSDVFRKVLGDGAAPRFAGLSKVVPTTNPVTNGRLMKIAGNSAVYYFDGIKRYVFPNETTYKTWYADFSKVEIVTPSELQLYPIGGNVTIRPGTWLVKATDSSNVYAVESGGVLQAFDSATRVATLYGNMWMDKVVSIPPSFFVNYKVGSTITTNKHPAGTLIKYSGSSSYYYIGTDGLKHLVSASALIANHLQTNFAVETTIQYGTGSQINAFDSKIGSASGTWYPQATNPNIRYANFEFPSAVDLIGSGQISYNTPVKYMLFESVYPMSDASHSYSYNFNNPIWVSWDVPGAIWATKVMRYLISRPATAGMYYIIRVSDDKGNTELNTVERKWGVSTPPPPPPKDQLPRTE
ncbi:MAG: hypothetical protein V1712_02600 [Patescibacteria group bacterium]